MKIFTLYAITLFQQRKKGDFGKVIWLLRATLEEGSGSAASGNIITKHRVAFIQYKESVWSYHKMEDKCQLIKSPGGQQRRRCHIVSQRAKTLFASDSTP